MADNMPDFDSMSPEEIMAWMETLAKRQGASEGFMTAADADIAEIDPDTVVIDEPGYVPYGQEAPTQTSIPAAPSAPASAEPARPAAASRPVSSPPPTPPVVTPPAITSPATATTPPPPQPPVVQPAAPSTWTAPTQPAASRPADDFETLAPQSVEEGSLAWLESLAADQGDSLFTLDLSSLGEENAPEPAATATDPVAWLEDLARSQGELPSQPPAPARTEPAPSDTDSMTWLETLARRQGANPDELITSADLDLPEPPTNVEEPAYTPFSFDTPATHRTPSHEPLRLDDPTAFLGSLASEQGYSEEGVRATVRQPQPEPEPPAEPDMSLEGIQQAINDGTVTPEQMQVFLEHETDVAAQEPEIVIEDYDPDAPPIPAELPDWLLEQVGPPPSAESQSSPQQTPPGAEQPALADLVSQPVSSDEMPDWLRGDLSSGDDVDLQSIFAQTEDEDALPNVVSTGRPALEIDVDPNDPWVEAFDQEHELGTADISTLPDWYEHNVNDPARIAAVERQAHADEEVEAEAAEAQAASNNGLVDEPLPPETELPLAVEQALPSWFTVPAEAALEAAPEIEPEAEAFASAEADAEADLIGDEEPLVAEIPDWLREVSSDVEPGEIPDWLKDTLTPEQDNIADLFTEQQPQPQPQPVIVAQAAPPPAAPPPQPTAPRPAVSGSLENARAKQETGDLDSSLAEYEALVRSNVDLDAVVEDLSRMVKAYRSNPAVYRVLGDGLMRQGKLQAALDTYREALNQL